MTSASAAQALEVLKAVEPKVYKRTDLQEDSPRLGFLAQDFATALPKDWANIVGSTGGLDEHLDEQGNTVPAKPSTLRWITRASSVAFGRRFGACSRDSKR